MEFKLDYKDFCNFDVQFDKNDNNDNNYMGGKIEWEYRLGI